MLKIRRSRDRLIFNMGIPIPRKDSLYIETGSRGRQEETRRQQVSASFSQPVSNEMETYASTNYFWP